MRLTASTSLQSVRERLGVGDAETLRESEKRRRYLQTYARLLTPTRPAVRFSGDLQTATTDHSGDAPEITVTTRAFGQPATDFRRRVFDLAIQEALVVHEIGHLRYTDSNGFRDLLAQAEPERRRLFSRVWNTLEDGAIERQLRHRYAVAPELEVLNANLFQAGRPGHEPSGAGTRRLSLFHAVICGLADMAVYDSGRFRRLRADDVGVLRMASVRDQRVLEEFVPTMRETVQTVLTEPDPAARNEHIWSFWQAFVDTLDASAVSGAGASELARLLDDDGTVRTGRNGRAATRRMTDAAVLPEDGAGAPLPGKPDDTAGEFSADTRLARDLARDTAAAELDRQIETVLDDKDGSTADSGTEVTGEDDERGREGAGGDADAPLAADRSGSGRTGRDGSTADALLNAQSHPGAGRLLEGQRDDEATGASTGTQGESGVASDPGAETGGSGDTAVPETPGEGDRAKAGDHPVADALRRRYNEELAAEASELDRAEARLDELEAYVRALDATEGEDTALQVVTGTDAGRNSAERWSDVRRGAKRLAKRFRSRLRAQRRDVERSRRRRGSLDRSRLVAASRGRSDVFTQTEDGTDRQYTCAVVLDRSGSMRDGAVTAAEQGALTAAVALETVGVDVTVFDLHDSTVRLIKTTAEAARETRGRVLTRQAGGGTPLAQALALSRTRFEDAENPFVLVVTDGLPDDEAAYTAQLDACTMPVLGVYLTDPDRPEERLIETDRSYFHQLAIVEDWGALDRQLQGLAGQVLF